MDRSANVTSLDAIRSLRSAVAKFEHGARDGLTQLELEVRRGVEWIEQDRRRYWPAQAKRAAEHLVEARTELERCQLRTGSEEAPACYEQKKKYERAKQRLRYCESQVRAVKKWTRTIRQELIEFQGQLAQMNQYLDADLPRALTTLGNMITALEKYASRHDGGGTESPATSAGLPDPSSAAADSEGTNSPKDPTS